MLVECACGKEILTEADPHVILPVFDYEVNCGCKFPRKLGGMIELITLLRKHTGRSFTVCRIAVEALKSNSLLKDQKEHPRNYVHKSIFDEVYKRHEELAKQLAEIKDAWKRRELCPECLGKVEVKDNRFSCDRCNLSGPVRKEQ